MSQYSYTTSSSFSRWLWVKSEGHHKKEERKGRCVLFLGSAPIFVDDTVRGGCSTQWSWKMVQFTDASSWHSSYFIMVEVPSCVGICIRIHGWFIAWTAVNLFRGSFCNKFRMKSLDSRLRQSQSWLAKIYLPRRTASRTASLSGPLKGGYPHSIM